jgi:hypothetical protein
MGKQTDNGTDDDYELKVLIDKRNVRHLNLDTDHGKVCKNQHGKCRKDTQNVDDGSRQSIMNYLF